MGLIEEFRERAKPWIDPIAADSPTGKFIKFDPVYESIATEVAKLEAPSAPPVNWERVVDVGGTFLKRNCKDLRIACYVFYGLHVTRGWNGLLEGLSALAELLERYWLTLSPEPTRPRARVNAVTWFVERTGMTLSAAQVAPQVAPLNRDTITALEQATKQLAQVVREKMGNDGPAFGPILTTLERFRLNLPEELPPKRDSATAPQAVARQATPSAAPVADLQRATPPVATLQQTANTMDFLREVGNSLAEAAAMLRHDNIADPTSYRLLRTGLWLHFKEMPPAGPNGRTNIPPPPASLLTQLNTMASNGKWENVLEEAESALVMHRFSLDLQRLSAQALAALGHRPAREALIREVAGWLRRMPSAPKLLASDGTAFADPITKEWLDQEVRTVSSPPGAEQGAAGALQDETALVEKAKALLADGKAVEGITLLKEQLRSAEPGRDRFKK